MRRHTRTQRGGLHTASMIIVDGVAPNPDFDHDPLPDQILGIALDQRAFGPRRLMVAFGAYDGRFLALMYTRRRHPIDPALEACLLHFDTLGRGGEAYAAAVVLCDQAVEDGPHSAEFIATFERAKAMPGSRTSIWSTGSPVTTTCSGARDDARSHRPPNPAGGTCPTCRAPHECYPTVVRRYRPK